jgi:hypothetical protein
MSSIISTAIPEHRVTLHHSEAVARPDEMTFFYHGLKRTVRRNTNEAPDAFWVRVLGVIGQARRASQVQRDSTLNADAMVHCYAGELDGRSLELLQRHYMQQHIIDQLNAIVCNQPKKPKRGDTTAKIRALALMSQMTGMVAPKKFRNKVEPASMDNLPPVPLMPVPVFNNEPRQPPPIFVRTEA